MLFDGIYILFIMEVLEYSWEKDPFSTIVFVIVVVFWISKAIKFIIKEVELFTKLDSKSRIPVAIRNLLMWGSLAVILIIWGWNDILLLIWAVVISLFIFPFFTSYKKSGSKKSNKSLSP